MSLKNVANRWITARARPYPTALLFGALVSLFALYGPAQASLLCGVLGAPGAVVAMLVDLADVHGGNVFFRIMGIANFVIYSLIFLIVARIFRSHTRR